MSNDLNKRFHLDLDFRARLIHLRSELNRLLVLDSEIEGFPTSCERFIPLIRSILTYMKETPENEYYYQINKDVYDCEK